MFKFLVFARHKLRITYLLNLILQKIQSLIPLCFIHAILAALFVQCLIHTEIFLHDLFFLQQLVPAETIEQFKMLCRLQQCLLLMLGM